MIEKIKLFLKCYLWDDSGKWTSIDKDVKNRIKKYFDNKQKK